MSRQPIYNIYWKLVYKLEIRYGRSCWWCQSISKNSTLSYLQLYFICCHFNHNISLDERNWNFGLVGARWPQTWMLGYLIASSYRLTLLKCGIYCTKSWEVSKKYISTKDCLLPIVYAEMLCTIWQKKSISHGLVTLNSGVK